jgi:hypothetical protein
VTSYAAERMSLLYAEMAVLFAASFFCVNHVFSSIVLMYFYTKFVYVLYGMSVIVCS